MSVFLYRVKWHVKWIKYAMYTYFCDNNNNNNHVKEIISRREAENFFEIAEIWMQMPHLRSEFIAANSLSTQSTNNITNQHSTPNNPHNNNNIYSEAFSEPRLRSVKELLFLLLLFKICLWILFMTLLCWNKVLSF